MFTNKKAIQAWLHEMRISGTHINKDLTVDVFGNVNLSYKKLTALPIQFGVINGYFNALCNDFTTLKGFPFVVGGNFQCHLEKDFDFSLLPTQKVSKNFFCLSEVNIENLKKLFNSPIEIKGNFSHLTHHEEDKIALFEDSYNEMQNKNNTTSYVLNMPYQAFKEVMRSYLEKEQLEQSINEQHIITSTRLKI
jgi:hypothetical protein